MIHPVPKTPCSPLLGIGGSKDDGDDEIPPVVVVRLLNLFTTSRALCASDMVIMRSCTSRKARAVKGDAIKQNESELEKI